MPIRECIFTRSNYSKNSVLRGKKIAFEYGTIQEKHLIYLKKKYGLIGIGFDSIWEKTNALFSKKVDFALGDNIETWNIEGLQVFRELDIQYGDGFGIVFPKKSPYKEKLDKIIKYYTRSTWFHKILVDSYGKEVSDYFKKIHK